jgi:hypothetical protein
MQVRGVEAIKTTLQKAEIHRDHRDKRRTTLLLRFGQQRRIFYLRPPALGDHGDFGEK